jgi:hypothetical protein
MKQRLMHGCAFVGAVLFALAAGPAGADAWDQTLASNKRFVVLSNMNSEAVLDRETELVWQRSTSGNNSWPGGVASCQNARTGGRFGWRLPTVQELGSLLDPNATSGPPLPLGHPFIGIPASAFFWTATSSANNPGLITPVLWGSAPPPANFFVQVGALSVGQDGSLGVWCVRGGMLAGPQ